MTFFLFTIIFVAVCVFVVLKTSKKDEPQQPSQQPIHFDFIEKIRKSSQAFPQTKFQNDGNVNK